MLQIFIFMTGVFVSSWIGGILLSIGEWIIKKLPLVKHIYSAAKQVTTPHCCCALTSVHFVVGR